MKKKSLVNVKKPYKVAAMSGIWMIVLGFLVSMILQIFRPWINPVAFTFLQLSSFYVLMILGITFSYGFVEMGKKYKSKLLVVMAWIGITFAIIFLVVSILSNIVNGIGFVSAQEIVSYSDYSQVTKDYLVGFLISYYISSLFVGLYSVLMGIGLIRLRGKVKHSYLAGVLNITAGATYFIFLGLFIQIAALVVEIIMFKELSKKLEK